jgi:hypothetical protein
MGRFGVSAIDLIDQPKFAKGGASIDMSRSGPLRKEMKRD